MRVALGIACCGLVFSVAAGPAAGGGPPSQVHVILFVPSGVTPPAGYQQRIDDIVACSEAFLQREMRRWGHTRAVMPFRRSPNGRVEVTLLRGKEPTASYTPVSARMEVMDAMRARNRVQGGRQTWWIMVYPGDPPARFKSFVGGFGVQIGGWAVCNFDTTPGRLDPAAQLGADLAEKLAVKGMLHELGHGFQLPHIGPLDRDKAGNTLMGPTHINYKRVRGFEEPRVYLSEAEAAILSTQPAFRGVSEDPGILPTLQVREMNYRVDLQKRTLLVTGRAQASKRALYALVADEVETRPGEYWTKTYVGKVAPDGSFQVTVSEPAPASGTLRTWFAFENGAVTGDGKLRSRGSGIPKPYTFRQNQWTFE
jgi:hypothetical protein